MIRERIWFEGRLTAEPRFMDREPTCLLNIVVATASGPKRIVAKASGTEHLDNIRRNAAKGGYVIARATTPDTDADQGVDAVIRTIAFGPSRTTNR